MSHASKEAEALVRQLSSSVRIYEYKWEIIKCSGAAKAILVSDLEVKRAVVGFTVDTINAMWSKWEAKSEWKDLWFGEMIEGRTLPRAAMEVGRRLLMQDLKFPEGELVSLLECTARIHQLSTSHPFLEPLIRTAERFAAANGVSAGLQAALKQLRPAIYWENAPERKLKDRIKALLGGELKSPMQRGEAWSDQALDDLEAMEELARRRWLNLLDVCAAPSASSPSPKWIKIVKESLGAVGFAEFKRRLLAWCPMVDKLRTREITDWNPDYQPNPNELIVERHADVLKGLVWCCGLREDKELTRALTALALSCYRKIPAKGPREVKVGNACVTALGMMPGMEAVGQLALLKVRVKFGTAQKMIAKALENTAKRVGLPREELEEMAAPGYGMTEVGARKEQLGDYTAELTVTSSGSMCITWALPGGKRQASVPAIVKQKFANDLNELRTAAKDIQRMLPSQRERIDNLFREEKTWAIETWRARYLDHPLIGVLARRLIWEFTTGSETKGAIFFNGGLVDLDLKPLTELGGGTTVRLWHPIGKDPGEIVAWRGWLDEQKLQQPFKQAHREVYLLTDAERRTRTYSNRFAAHILRQHQFNALCAARGWRNKLRLMVDAEFPPAALYLPKWNLRAEFWIEGVGEDYGTDTNESGVFLRLATDQVRFYQMEAVQRTAHASGGGGYHLGRHVDEAEPVPLENIPPLVFSEVMRDVDLFVGVASVGNDPTWSDGGPDGRFQQYWQSYSFGELNATARTRGEVLERLVPRLKIANQCSFQEKFLVVKGTLRTYKIHLGSGNILMKPNDQYLCIVPKQSAGNEDQVLLPFEGDRTLSLILSKAFLLAEDTKIRDETIIRQIRQL